MFKIDVRRKVDFMRTLYEAIAERLKRVDFNEIWTGFHPFEFALYNSQHIALSNCDLPWNEKFVGNTAIQYEGKYIAIWNIEDYHNTKIDPDELAADLVHEMFHAYQMTLGETRFPDDLLMLHYPQEIQNCLEKYEENTDIVKALREENSVLRQQYLCNFCERRKKREQRIGNIIKQEYLSETLEGMAEYAGLTALQMLDLQKYQSRVKRYTDYLESLDLRQLDWRRMSYYSGACVIILVKELGWSIAHTIGKEEKSVFEIICERRHGCKKSAGNTGVMTDIEKELSLFRTVGGCIHDSDLTEPERIEAMKQLLEQLKDEQRQIIKKFQEKELHKITGEFRICGYDPMNVFYIDGFLYCSTFMAISDDDYKNEKRLFGESLMELIPSTYNKVSCYSYIK